MARNFDQIRTQSPLTSVDGNETFLVNQNGVTRGGILQAIKTWLESTITISKDRITATPYFRSLFDLADVDALKNEVIDLDDLKGEILPPLATLQELNDGTEMEPRLFNPKQLKGLNPGKLPGVDIAANTTLASATHLERLLICNGADLVLTLNRMNVPVGSIISILNIHSTDVTIAPDNTGGQEVTLVGGTGVVGEFEFKDLVFIGNHTWFVRQ